VNKMNLIASAATLLIYNKCILLYICIVNHGYTLK